MSSDSSKIGRVTLWLFAAVGAIASVLTINHLITDSKPKLSGEVYVNKYMMPNSFVEALAFGDRDNLDDCGRKLQRAFDCDTPESEKEDGDRGWSHDCGHLAELDELSDKVSAHEYSDVAYLDIRLENRGDKVARGIRYQPRSFIELDVRSASGTIVELDKTDTQQLVLPDLNPGEALKIELLARDPVFRYDQFSYDSYVPSITYEDGRASFVVFAHDFANDSDRMATNSIGEWIFIVFVAIVGSFVVVLIVVGLSSVAVGIYRGAPVQEWLNSFDKPHETGESAESEA